MKFEIMEQMHAHEVLRMMEGNSYGSEQALKGAIVERFGEQQRFKTCSVSGLDIDSLILFLKKKGKFKPAEDGFTMDITKVCQSY